MVIDGTVCQVLGIISKPDSFISYTTAYATSRRTSARDSNLCSNMSDSFSNATYTDIQKILAKHFAYFGDDENEFITLAVGFLDNEADKPDFSTHTAALVSICLASELVLCISESTEYFAKRVDLKKVEEFYLKCLPIIEESTIPAEGDDRCLFLAKAALAEVAVGIFYTARSELLRDLEAKPQHDSTQHLRSYADYAVSTEGRAVSAKFAQYQQSMMANLEQCSQWLPSSHPNLDALRLSIFKSGAYTFLQEQFAITLKLIRILSTDLESKSTNYIAFFMCFISILEVYYDKIRLSRQPSELFDQLKQRDVQLPRGLNTQMSLLQYNWNLGSYISDAVKTCLVQLSNSLKGKEQHSSQYMMVQIAIIKYKDRFDWQMEDSLDSRKRMVKLKQNIMQILDRRNFLLISGEFIKPAVEQAIAIILEFENFSDTSDIGNQNKFLNLLQALKKLLDMVYDGLSYSVYRNTLEQLHVDVPETYSEDATADKMAANEDLMKEHVAQLELWSADYDAHESPPNAASSFDVSSAGASSDESRQLHRKPKESREQQLTKAELLRNKPKPVYGEGEIVLDDIPPSGNTRVRSMGSMEPPNTVSTASPTTGSIQVLTTTSTEAPKTKSTEPPKTGSRPTTSSTIGSREVQETESTETPASTSSSAFLTYRCVDQGQSEASGSETVTQSGDNVLTVDDSSFKVEDLLGEKRKRGQKRRRANTGRELDASDSD